MGDMTTMLFLQKLSSKELVELVEVIDMVEINGISTKKVKHYINT